MAALVAAVLVLTAFPGSPGIAADEPLCEDFLAQEDAQQVLDAGDGEDELDADGNGEACEDLPARPDELEETLFVRFESSGKFPVIEANGWEIWIGGLDDAGAIGETNGVRCDDLVTADALEIIIPEDASLYVQTSEGEIPEAEADEYDRWVGDGIVWYWDGDSDPVNVAEWVIANGYGVYASRFAPEGWEDRLEDAQAAAREDDLGIWGTCEDLVPIESGKGDEER